VASSSTGHFFRYPLAAVTVNQRIHEAIYLCFPVAAWLCWSTAAVWHRCSGSEVLREPLDRFAVAKFVGLGKFQDVGEEGFLCPILKTEFPHRMKWPKGSEDVLIQIWIASNLVPLYAR
jgi:hypothetical protein